MNEKMQIMEAEKIRLQDINYRTWGPMLAIDNGEM
jgi:hypothetical protein